MAKNYDISSKADMRKFQKDLEKNIMNEAVKQANQAKVLFICPKCSFKFMAHVGINICPSCKEQITITPVS